MPRPDRTRRRALLATASLLLLTGCGGSDHAEADVRFAQQMIPHHAQAVEMSEQALATSDTPDVRRLAEEIRGAQGPEIETMTGWLQDWDEAVPTTGTEMGEMSGMEGMLGEADLERLEEARGAAFDRLWLRSMIEHHRGAVEMARAQQAEGEHDGATALAAEVEESQTREISAMEELLG